MFLTRSENEDLALTWLEVNKVGPFRYYLTFFFKTWNYCDLLIKRSSAQSWRSSPKRVKWLFKGLREQVASRSESVWVCCREMADGSEQKMERKALPASYAAILRLFCLLSRSTLNKFELTTESASICSKNFGYSRTSHCIEHQIATHTLALGEIKDDFEMLLRKLHLKICPLFNLTNLQRSVGYLLSDD